MVVKRTWPAESLAVDECGRSHQPLAVLGRHLDEIAEHIVVLDLEDADAGFFGVARLQCGNDTAGFIAQRTRFVERCVVALAHESAIALEGGQFRRQCSGQFGGEHPVRLPARLVSLRRFPPANS